MNRSLLTILILLSGFNFSKAQHCPRNEYDCKGACGWFMDADGDGYCDLTSFSDALLKKLLNKKDTAANSKNTLITSNKDSVNKNESGKQEKNIKTTETKSTSNNTGETNPKTKCPFENTPSCNKNSSVEPCNHQSDTAAVKTAEVQNNSGYKIKKYDLALIFSFCVLLYLVSLLFVKIKTYKKSTHRKIWNVLLLLTFLNTGLTGLFLVIQLNYHVLFDWFAKILYWHVEFGISMAAISILHILWHWKYFKNMIMKHQAS